MHFKRSLNSDNNIRSHCPIHLMCVYICWMKLKTWARLSFMREFLAIFFFLEWMSFCGLYPYEFLSPFFLVVIAFRSICKTLHFSFAIRFLLIFFFFFRFVAQIEWKFVHEICQIKMQRFHWENFQSGAHLLPPSSDWKWCFFFGFVWLFSKQIVEAFSVIGIIGMTFIESGCSFIWIVGCICFFFFFIMSESDFLFGHFHFIEVPTQKKVLANTMAGWMKRCDRDKYYEKEWKTQHFYCISHCRWWFKSSNHTLLHLSSCMGGRWQD